MNYDHIEEEILSYILLKSWEKIEIELICYQISLTTKADHYDLKSDEAITAFKIVAKENKKI